MIQNRTLRSICTTAVFLPTFLVCTVWANNDPLPLDPAEALRSFELEPGLRIDAIATEPLVFDPVAFAFDEQSRLYVIEARGYPDDSAKGRGAIVMLTDADGDGVYDTRCSFADGLNQPNGLMPWRGGVFVTTAPDIIYLKDHDGDGRADERRIILTGFDASKTSQLRVSHPTLGLDGRIYVTSGLSGGKVHAPGHPGRPPVMFSPADGSFDPGTFEYEVTGGRGQFGLSFDRYGRRFVCSNRHPVMQVVLERSHLQRNPHLAFTETMQAVSAVEAEAKVYPISGGTVTADFAPQLISARHSGTFTSACGVLSFPDSGLGAERVDSIFICEPAQNLVQRQIIEENGASLRSRPALAQREFLASRDAWFRPVFLTTGPDGALYMADMYRREIDHPAYLPAEMRDKLDFASGRDRGRIYRVARNDLPPAGHRSFTSANPLELLDHEVEWVRATGFRILLERGDAPPGLETLVRTGRPETRIRALWLLHLLGTLRTETLAGALRDAHSQVQAAACRIAQTGAGLPELLPAIASMSSTADGSLALAVALALGTAPGSPAALDALARIGAEHGADRWIRAAVLSGVAGNLETFTAAVLSRSRKSHPGFVLLVEELARVVGAGGTPLSIRNLLERAFARGPDFDWRLAVVLGLVEGTGGRRDLARGADAGPQDLFKILELPAAEVSAFLAQAATIAAAETVPVASRVRAASVLSFADMQTAGSVLGRLLDARQPPEVQLQAVGALGRIGELGGAQLLLRPANWSGYTPRIRDAVIGALSSQPETARLLFRSIESGAVAVTDISPMRRVQFMKHSDPTVRDLARKVFKSLESGDRMAVYHEYRSVLEQPGDASRGAAVFARACSACHTHGETGGKLGPDLSGIRNQPAEAILLHIIVPNYEVTPTYQTFSVVTTDGRTQTGYLAAETDQGVTLRTPFGTEETILRAQIESIRALGTSIMPDGLEQAMSKQEVADLIAHLKSPPNPADTATRD